MEDWLALDRAENLSARKELSCGESEGVCEVDRVSWARESACTERGTLERDLLLGMAVVRGLSV